MSSPIGRFISLEGIFVFTLTNNGYKYFTLNLVEHLKRAKVPWKLCVVCADASSFRFFQIQSIDCVKASSFLPETGPDISPFGTTHFQRLNRKKVELLTEFVTNPAIKHGIYMDGDIAVYNDFVPDIVTRLNTGPEKLFLQCDEGSVADCSGCPCPNGCTGFIAWSHSISPTIFRVNTETMAIWKEKPEDQVFVNRMLKQENVVWGTLPRGLYANGQFVSRFRVDPTKKENAMLLHYNYLVGMDKQRRMKSGGDWLIQF
ncbi:MAG: hypothetical protein EBV30_08360 [Actinobacteria bacterium]|nr:hypothetical protein [Actinomycetota bacterium]